VFSDHLLYPSETFIRSQASALSAFEPIFAGSRRVAGLELPDDKTYTINKGGLRGALLEFAFKLAGFAPGFAQRLSALKPVLMHAHYAANGFRVLPLVKHLRLPLVVTLHGSDITATDTRYEPLRFGQRRYLANKEKLQKNGSLFLAVSNFLRRKLLQQGFPQEKVLVHYIGVNTSIFHPASTERERLILFVGRFVECKGVELLIQAAAEVQNHLPDTELVLIGDGSLRSSLEIQAKSLLRRYQFLGACSPEDVRMWMNRASVICAPSIRARSGAEEAFGMVCAEAQAVAKPVVAFNSGGISEVVAHERTGFLAPEGNCRALAQYLILLLESPELRQQFGHEGRRRVLEAFDLEQRTRVLESIYANVASQILH